VLKEKAESDEELFVEPVTNAQLNNQLKFLKYYI